MHMEELFSVFQHIYYIHRNYDYKLLTGQEKRVEYTFGGCQPNI